MENERISRRAIRELLKTKQQASDLRIQPSLMAKLRLPQDAKSKKSQHITSPLRKSQIITIVKNQQRSIDLYLDNPKAQPERDQSIGKGK